jgi:hypothetical protein
MIPQEEKGVNEKRTRAIPVLQGMPALVLVLANV